MTESGNRITITVKSFATLREVMDAQLRMEVEEGATIRSLFATLSRRYKGLDERLFAGPGTFRDYVNILKNGRNIQFLAALDTPLEDGDTIAMFPPIAGG